MNFKVQDHYYKKAKRERFFARSVFKLEEIDKKFGLLERGMRVVDLGCYPGSWCQYAASVVGASGAVLGIDIKPMGKRLAHLKNFRCYEMDIFELKNVEGEKADILLSDMAPNTTGIKSLDQDRSLNLVEKVFDMVPSLLRPGGRLLVKVFDSDRAREFLRGQRSHFAEFSFFRPQATRSVSKEFFVIAKGAKASIFCN